jgi:hypothetical protein
MDMAIPNVLKNRDTACATPCQGMTWSFAVAWAHKGGFAILDQALFAGTNFLVNVLLARWLEPAQYGAFAVAYAVFLLLTTFHTAVLTEPMLVFGAGKYADRFPQYMGLLISGHCWVASLIALLLAVAALTMRGLGPAHLPQALTDCPSPRRPFCLCGSYDGRSTCTTGPSGPPLGACCISC